MSTGILPSAWDSLHRTKVLIKGPISAPHGVQDTSLDSMLCKSLGLFARINHIRSFAPFIAKGIEGLNITIIHDNDEGIYSTYEYRRNENTLEHTSLITQSGSEQLIRLGFEYAALQKSKSITCISHNTRNKITDGLFSHLFNEIAQDYPDIKAQQLNLDEASSLLANNPSALDIIITENQFSHSLIATALALSGAVTMQHSSTIGTDCAIGPVTGQYKLARMFK